MAEYYNSRDQIIRTFNSYQAPFCDLAPGETIWDQITAAGVRTGGNRYQNKTAADQPPLPLGTVWQLFDGRTFRYVKFVGGTAAAEGSVLGMATSVQEEVVAFAVGATQITGGGVTTTWDVNEFAGYYVTVDVGSGVGQTRRIAANDSTVLYLESALDTVSDGNSDITIWHPYICQLAPAALTSHAVGVSVGQIDVGDTTARYGWVQTRGLCMAVKVDAAVAAGSLIVPSNATAGNAEQANEDATNAVLRAQCLFGRALSDASVITTTGRIPAMLFCE